MSFLKRGEATQRVLDAVKPLNYHREPEKKPAPPPLHCPRCGKQLGRGKHMHLKHCKG